MQWGLSYISHITLGRFHTDPNVPHLLQACGVILNLLRQQDNHAEIPPFVWKLQDLFKYVGEESVFLSQKWRPNLPKTWRLPSTSRQGGRRKKIYSSDASSSPAWSHSWKTRDNRILVLCNNLSWHCRYVHATSSSLQLLSNDPFPAAAKLCFQLWNLTNQSCHPNKKLTSPKFSKDFIGLLSWIQNTSSLETYWTDSIYILMGAPGSWFWE